MENKNYIGIIAALTVAAAGIGGYLFWKKSKKESKPSSLENTSSSEKSEEAKSGSSTDESTNKAEPKKEESKGDKPKAETPKLGGAKACSEIVNLAGDKTYEYRKCDNVWFTRKKIKPNERLSKQPQWISLANNKAATDKLNFAFPKL
jgi:hypothetical protein